MDQQPYNPYAAPVAQPSSALGRQLFPELAFGELKKLYNRSCNVRALIFIWGLVSVVMMLMFLTSVQKTNQSPIILLTLPLITALFIITAIGCWQRAGWGRIMGLITCSIMLISSIPQVNIVGGLIGIVGLFSLANGKSLFGPNRHTHTDIKQEYKFRKQHSVS